MSSSLEQHTLFPLQRVAEARHKEQELKTSYDTNQARINTWQQELSNIDKEVKDDRQKCVFSVPQMSLITAAFATTLAFLKMSAALLLVLPCKLSCCPGFPSSEKALLCRQSFKKTLRHVACWTPSHCVHILTGALQPIRS